MSKGLMPMTALSQCHKLLQDAGIGDARSISQILVCHVLNCGVHEILMSDKPIKKAQVEQLAKLTGRVFNGEPVQYVVGYADFMGMRFTLTKDVLIPRFDTETLVQWAVTRSPKGKKIADVCTGSGCVAITVKALRPDLEVSACDISEAALLVAQQNAQRLQSDVRFALGDLLTPFKNETFDIIVSNPPYISAAEYASLPAMVKEYEPRLALYGGQDGLDVYRRLIGQAASHLNAGGALGVEIGYEQADAISNLFLQYGFADVQVLLDMDHRPRVVAGEWEEQR